MCCTRTLACLSYAIMRYDSPFDIPAAGGFINSTTWAAMFIFTAPAATTSLPGFDSSVVVREAASLCLCCCERIAAPLSAPDLQSFGCYWYRVVDRTCNPVHPSVSMLDMLSAPYDPLPRSPPSRHQGDALTHAVSRHPALCKPDPTALIFALVHAGSCVRVALHRPVAYVIPHSVA